MNNFEYKNPTKIIFGKGQIAQLSKEIPRDAKVLLLYGGGSIKKTGIYEQVTKALLGYNLLEYGGIPPNPEYSVLMGALKIIKEEKVDFLLAVGSAAGVVAMSKIPALSFIAYLRYFVYLLLAYTVGFLGVVAVSYLL